MRQVKIEKSRLLEIMKKNRDAHRATFLKAQAKFREVAIDALDEQLEAARDGRPFMLGRLTALVEPQDHTKAYDRVIQMLEMSVEDTIVVTDSEFQNYVQDIWSWSRAWAMSSSRYTDSERIADILSDQD